MRKRLALIGLWLGATAGATAVAWAAVQAAVGDVADPVPLRVRTAPAETVDRGGTAASPTTVAGGPAGESAASPPPTPRGEDGGEVPRGAEAAETRRFDLVGGVVVVRFSPGAVEIVTATPRTGFRLHEVEREGPSEWKVEFRSDAHRSRLDVWWRGGPRHAVEERPD